MVIQKRHKKKIQVANRPKVEGEKVQRDKKDLRINNMLHKSKETKKTWELIICYIEMNYDLDKYYQMSQISSYLIIWDKAQIFLV